jgi:hypothetical protein
MASIQDNQEENDQAVDRSGVSAPGPLQTVGNAAPGGMATPDKRPQGSGRFTNLQKYIQANQGAGQQIAGQVGKGVKKEIGKEEREAGEYYKNLGSAISGARKVTEEGAKYQETLNKIGQNIGSAKLGEGATIKDYENRKQDLGIQKFTQDPGFNQYQNIQAGRGIDERLLALRQQQAAKESGEYLQSAQDAQEALGSEGGRFNLLRKTFGGAARPGYSTGQQRLDQALLSQQGLGGLRSDISQDLKSATESQRLAQQGAGTVASLASQEQGIMSGLNTQAGLNEEAFMDMLGSYVDPVQQQRQTEWDQLGSAVDAYKTKEMGQQGLTSSQLAQLGVTAPTRSFDVMENLNGVGDIAVQGTEAKTAQDVATQGDVDRYAALAKMMGSDSRQNITQAADLGSAYSAQTGDSALANRLSSRQDQFNELAGNTNLYANINDSGRGMSMAEANALDMVSGGRSAINQLASTRSGGRTQNAQGVEDNVYQQFQDFLNQQNYARTLGGKAQGDEYYGTDEYIDPSVGFKGK